MSRAGCRLARNKLEINSAATALTARFKLSFSASDEISNFAAPSLLVRSDQRARSKQPGPGLPHLNSRSGPLSLAT